MLAHQNNQNAFLFIQYVTLLKQINYKVDSARGINRGIGICI